MSILAAANTAILAQGRRPNNNVDVDGDGWDLETFFNNATTYTQTIGGAFLALLGIAGIVWGGTLLIRKLMGSQKAQQDSWLKIVFLVIVGGAMLFGGMTILLKFAKGSNKTIEQFGEGGGALVLAQDQVNALVSQATDVLAHVPALTGAGVLF